MDPHTMLDHIEQLDEELAKVATAVADLRPARGVLQAKMDAAGATTHNGCSREVRELVTAAFEYTEDAIKVAIQIAGRAYVLAQGMPS